MHNWFFKGMIIWYFWLKNNLNAFTHLKAECGQSFFLHSPLFSSYKWHNFITEVFSPVFFLNTQLLRIIIRKLQKTVRININKFQDPYDNKLCLFKSLFLTAEWPDFNCLCTKLKSFKSAQPDLTLSNLKWGRMV